MQDTLTGQPVAQGWAVLESGTQLAATSVYSFSPTLDASSDVHGAFSLCAPAVSTPAVVVLLALDASGKAYPAFVASVSGAAELGTVPMGGCQVLCGFEGQEQTSSPATITGAIGSAPVAETEAVLAEYTMSALDGSKNLWSVAMAIPGGQSDSFTTSASACLNGALFCTAYTVTMPSQEPVHRVSGGYQQGAGTPDYSIYATVSSPAQCTPPFSLTIFQQDGESLLAGTPGAQLSAAAIQFSNCR